MLQNEPDNEVKLDFLEDLNAWFQSTLKELSAEASSWIQSIRPLILKSLHAPTMDGFEHDFLVAYALKYDGMTCLRDVYVCYAISMTITAEVRSLTESFLK